MLWIFLGTVLMAALIKAHQRQQAKLPDRNDPRWMAPPRPQIAGRPCVECGLKLITAGEGMPCPTCEEIVHLDTCHTRHVASAHGVKTDMPYR